MLDNSQFRKKDHFHEFPYGLFIFLFIIGIGIIIGMFITFFGIMFNFNNVLENNGLMYEKDCKVNIQPKIICSNYTIKDNYYYCDINDVEVLP